MTGCCLKSRWICPPKQLFVEVTAAILVLVILTVLYLTTGPVHQGFFCDDESISFPYRQETVKSDIMLGVTFTGTLLALLIVELPRLVCQLKRQKAGEGDRQVGEKCSVGRVVCVYGAYVYGYLVITLITTVTKLSSGQLRPHFLAVCKPNVDLNNCTGYIESYTCTNQNVSEKELQNARESFPSGHASNAFYCAVYIVMYIESCVRVQCARLPKLTLHTSLIATALYVSATRITDHHHHHADVIGGALLGIIVALVIYVQVTRHWIREEPAEVPDPESQNYNNSNTDVYVESMEPTTPTPLLTKVGLEKSRHAVVHIGPLRLQIP